MRMYIRKLKLEDAKSMLEWMHDESVTKYLKKDFSSLTLKDCESFILKSISDYKKLDDAPKNDISINMAIVSDDDLYQGTVSLKNIDFKSKDAEFAITTCAKVHGKGYAQYAMKWIMEFAFNSLSLNKVYWNCSTQNSRAFKFYLKLFGRIMDFHIEENNNESLVIFFITRNEFFKYYG